jgi:hypothetical protein
VLVSVDETFDVGADTRTPADDSYAVPFRFTGIIDKLTFKLGPPQITEADKSAIDKGLKSKETRHTVTTYPRRRRSDMVASHI